MTTARRIGRVATIVALWLAPAVLPGPGWAGELSSVAIGRVRIEGGKNHQVWLTALDDAGRPVTGLMESSFTITEDAGPVERLELEAWSDVHDRSEVTLVVDPDLLAGRHRVSLARAVRALGEKVGENGRLRVVSAGAGFRSAEASGADADELAGRIAGLARAADEPRLYDALFSEVRRAARLPGRTGRVLMLLTRGGDFDSRRGVVEILAIGAEYAHPVPVFVAFVADGGRIAEYERLTRLGLRTGGVAERVPGIAALEPVALRFIDRARGSYRLRFRPLRWDGSVKNHELRFEVAHDGRRRVAAVSFESAAVTAAAWWRRPATWLWLSTFVGLAMLVALAFHRRPLFILHVDGGEEEGNRFEVFGTPLTVGAAEGNDVTFDEPRLSRNHSVLDRRGGAIEIVDLNSENGTFVNGERVTRRQLADGDQINLGQTVELTFESGTR